MAFIHNRQLKILKSVVKKSPIRKKHLISCTRQEINKKARKVQTNLLARYFVATRPHEKLVTDVSYVYHKQGRPYLSIIKHFYDNSYLAYTLSKFMIISQYLRIYTLFSDNIETNPNLVFYIQIKDFSTRTNSIIKNLKLLM